MPVSENIHEICALGLQTLDFLETNEKPPDSWIQVTSNRIKQSEQGQAEVQIAIIPAIKKLFEAAIKPSGLTRN